MPIIQGKKADYEAAIRTAVFIAASARTSPKARGVDNIITAIVSGKEKEKLAEAMEDKAKQKSRIGSIFKRDAELVRQSICVLLVAVKGTQPKKPSNPINCGACGYSGCAEFIASEKKRGEDFTGPICIFEALDLGIALGSAIKTASIMNVDNRLMYTIGAAAKKISMIEGDVIIGIPLSCTGKNIYFDRN